MLKSKSKFKSKYLFATAAVTAAGSLVASGCGSSESASDTSISDISLSSVPSTSQMIKANSGSSAFLSENRSTTGTAPLITALKGSADSYFWNGLVAEINAAVSATSAQKEKFWGTKDGGPGGQGACSMAQSVGESFGRMLEAGTSQCYMKNIPNAASGVTITGASSADVFKPGSADKTVHVAVTQGGVTQQHVFIKVHGSDSVGSDVYKASLYFCSAQNSSTTPDGVEIMTINKSEKTMTSMSYHSESGGAGKTEVTAYLKKDGSDIVFDADKDRTAVSTFTGTWGNFKSHVTINKDNEIIAKMYNSGSGYVNKTYSIAKFSGSKFSELRFLEAGFKNYSSDNSSHTNTYSGAIEWQTNYYAANSSNSLKTEASTMDFSADSFYSSISTPTQDTSSYSCGATPDVNITMDFGNSAVAAIQTKCEGERFRDYDMCWNTSVNSAMQKAF